MLDLTWSPDRIRERSQEMQEQLIGWRRWLHQHPELSFREELTAHYIAEQLSMLGYQPRTRVGKLAEGDTIPEGGSLYGVVAVLNADKPGPAIALRADFDALPLTETTGLPYAVDAPAMHACGHDSHTTILLGTAAVLRELADQIPGPVVLLFQPAEELPPGGAKAMLEDGIFEEYNVGAVFGLHQAPQVDVGTMRFASGAQSASADTFTLTVSGPGGHGAMPHRTIDAVLVAAEIITGLHTIVSRQISPIDNAVITVGTIHGGTASNIIPAEVVMRGTVRTMSPKTRELIPQRMERMAKGIAEAHGASVEMQYSYGYPVLINDEEMTQLARRAAIHVLGEENVQPGEPTMGAEDFAYFLQRAPGSFANLGSGSLSIPQNERVPVHSPAFRLDEDCLSIGVAYYVALVQEYFGTRA